MFAKNGKQVAAGSPPQQEGMPSYWTTYIASDDVDDTAAKIRDAGGTVMLDPFDVFESGRMTIAQDPTGAVFGVWQAKEHIGAQLANEPGTRLWNQCHTPDPARAAEFYQAVFGYEIDEMDNGHGRRAALPGAQGRRPGLRRCARADIGRRAAALVDHVRVRRHGRERVAREGAWRHRADGALRPPRHRPACRDSGSRRRRLPGDDERAPPG